MMKRSLLCAAALCGSFTSSQAVDLLASESVAYDRSWGGAYIGVSLGYGTGDTETTFDKHDNDHLGAIALNPDGFALGANLGYNWQSGRWVYGVEGDLGYIDLSDSGQYAWDGHYLKSEIGSFWGTLRGRAGLAADRLLLYGTAGVAFMNFDEYGLTDNGNPNQNSYNNETRTGWVVGAGVEYAFSPRLSGKAEYLHMDFGESEGRNSSDYSWTFDNSVDLFRVGLNYKLGQGAFDALK